MCDRQKDKRPEMLFYHAQGLKVVASIPLVNSYSTIYWGGEGCVNNEWYSELSV